MSSRASVGPIRENVHLTERRTIRWLRPARGRPLFDGLAPEHIELERTRTLEGVGAVTHLHYRVVR
jgi:hypothetical protein